MKHIDKNKVISRFMDFDIYLHKEIPDTILNYEKDWNWLIPVYQKIAKKVMNDEHIWSELYHLYAQLELLLSEGNNIKVIHEAIYNWIKRYDELQNVH